MSLAGGAIHDGASAAIPERLRAEIAIIGSGCGGATMARVLAEAGRDVLVLEEGADLRGPKLDRSEAERYDQLYMDRAGRMTADLSISILQGRVLGGSAVINHCDVVPVRDELLEHWRRRFGLTELDAAAFARAKARALVDLHASPIPEERLNLANRLLRRGSQALGLRGEVMMHNRVGCSGLGTCLIGCQLDAKQNPRTVLLPAALAAGAKILCRARARRIDGATQATKTIAVEILDAKGYRVIGERRVEAETVVVAGNAVSTAELLLRSGLGNAHVGDHLILQPQLPIVAVFPEPVEAYWGIPQAFAVTEGEVPCHPEHGLWGFRIEAVMGTPGIVASLLPVVGLEGKELMMAFPRMAASLLLVPDAPSGSVRISGDRLVVDYRQTDEHRQRMREAAKLAARVYLAAGAERVILPVFPAIELRRESEVAQLDGLSLASATAPLVSAHQQGTVRLSPTPETGGASQEGLVWGSRGVYVADTSVFPSSASSHTMAPTIAMAYFLAERLAGRLPAASG